MADPETPSPSVLIASRVHMGNNSSNASSIPDALQLSIRSYFRDVVRLVRCGASARGALAVDAGCRVDAHAFDLLGAVRDILEEECGGGTDGGDAIDAIDILPVTPWGRFLPALNATVSWAAARGGSDCRLLLSSLESSSGLDARGIAVMGAHLEDGDTLVCGAALPGHDYRGGGEGPALCELTGRTCPWNTIALWDVGKLALTGFPAVGEGLHEGVHCAGVEEVSCVATLQRILTPERASAKLVVVPGIKWDTHWEDAGRRAWHEKKMASKDSRPARHLQLLGLEGKVWHY